MRTRIILIFIIVAVVVGGIIGYRAFVEKPARAADREKERSVSAVTLYNAFMQDEVAAGKLYNDKVVEVSGVVRGTHTGADGNMDVILETGDPIGAVVCEFAGHEKVATLKGDSVRIKGFCAGYDLDVLLQRCSISP